MLYKIYQNNTKLYYNKGYYLFYSLGQWLTVFGLSEVEVVFR